MHNRMRPSGLSRFAFLSYLAFALHLTAAACAQDAASGAGDLPVFKHQAVVLDYKDLKYNPCNDIIYPTVIEAARYFAKPLGRYYLYYAPHNPPGGICLAYADSPAGPWHEYAANPLIACDWAPHYKVSHVSGPHAIWNEEERKLFLYFHGENPVTRLASSVDGIHFDYEGAVVTTQMFEGVSEASYGRVFRYAIPGQDNRYIMLLMGNNRETRRIYLALSKDGRKWEARRTPLLDPPPGTDQVAGAWYLPWRGRHYLISHANRTSDPKAFNVDFNLYASEVDPAFEHARHLGRFFDCAAVSPTNAAVMSPCFIAEGNKLYLFYNIGPRLNQKIALATATAGDGESATPINSVLAWIRFDAATQDYLGTRYLFLGDGDLQLTFSVRPHPGHVLELLWGAKNDTREALLAVNGREAPLRQGGYNGFRRLRVPVPAGVTGDRYDVSLKAAGRPAFLGEVRLVARDKSDGAAPDLKAPSYRAALKATPSPRSGSAARGEVFPEMRKLWDHEPPAPAAMTGEEMLFRQAEHNARVAAEGLFRCRRYVDGWLAHADPATGLIPRNLRESRDFWNGRDSGADNYPFMVLTAAFTDRPLLEGRLLDMLRTETRLTCRINRLPDDYSFSKKGWRREQPDLDAMIFDGAEYVKDGLIPLTEWLGSSPWSERMTGIIDDIWKNAPIETPFGKIPTLNFEVNGDLLQAGARLYWFTGQRKYLDWAIRLGDYYLLGTNHPTRNLPELRLMDHGCEVINGLSELYVAVSHAAPEKRKAYQEPLHAILDQVLELGRNDDGLLYTAIQPKTGGHSTGLSDTWGYDYDAFYTLYLLDHTAAYREAVRKVLGNLKGKYVGAPWADKSADGYADSIEGAINLYNRERVEAAADWIDSQTRLMWAIQQSDGIIEGWHGDGNFARTTLMYVLWKTQGVHVEPWRADVRVGAVRDGGTLLLSLAADQPWQGRLLFDKPRHKLTMHLPLDYPRINQFPEWFTTEARKKYMLRDAASGSVRSVRGKEMQEGVAVELKPGVEARWKVNELTP